jgi:hypothetical protein
MPRSVYFFKFEQDIQAKKDKKTRQVEGTNYRYVSDSVYVLTDRDGRSWLSQDRYRNEP